MENKFKIYYFSGTHWDREWYQTFQGFRYRLVDTINNLIDTMETDPRYETYQFDGQSIVLEDYYEIEPERSEKLKKLISDGRVLTGPWYVMPDEFLLSGESLIRNLMIGHRLTSEWGGKPWKFGYVCDIFGHIAQMPQIFNGFSIDYAYLGRGTNEHNCPAFFVWESPDGSKCITYKLPDSHGYGTFSVDVLDIYHPENEKTDEWLREKTKEYIDYELKRTDLPFVIITDAMDHENVQADTPKYMDMMRELYENAEVYHKSLVDLGDELKNYTDKMPVKFGELNETGKEKGGYVYLISHTLSSRYPLKYNNDVCQNMLEKWIEPIGAILKAENRPLKRSYVNLAYKYLIQNHPHDSICGCSIDQVHKDMDYRFDQTKMIASELMDVFLNYSRQESGGDGDRAVLLWNPLPFDRKEAVTVDIHFPMEYKTKYAEGFGYEFINSFKIFDFEDNEIPYKLVSIKKNYKTRIYQQICMDSDVYTVTFSADLPAMGNVRYKVVPNNRPTRYYDLFTYEQNGAENDFIKFTINQNGTINLYNKETGIMYENLLSYVDDGEIGDGWHHVKPVGDKSVSSLGGFSSVETIENGVSKVVFKLTTEMKLPKHMCEYKHGFKRSEEYVTLVITSYISLTKEAKHLDVKTVIENTACDHRLRLKIPTYTNSDTYFAGQPFYFSERKAGINRETESWKEQEVYEKQMNGIAVRRDKNGNGLAFVSPHGLHECGGYDDADSSMYITLYRSFGRTIMKNGEKTGQLLEELSFNYAIKPVSKNDKLSDIVKLQDIMAAGIKAVDFPISGSICEAKSYFSIEGENVLLSILKVSEDESGIVARVYNMSDTKTTGRIKCGFSVSKASFVNMNEEYLSDLSGDKLEFDLEKWEVKTIKIVLL